MTSQYELMHLDDNSIINAESMNNNNDNVAIGLGI